VFYINLLLASFKSFIPQIKRKSDIFMYHVCTGENSNVLQHLLAKVNTYSQRFTLIRKGLHLLAKVFVMLYLQSYTIISVTVNLKITCAIL